jgi:glycine cleavage system aminomethyltransferase T
MKTNFAFVAVAILMSGFFGKAAMAQEKAKGEKASGRTVTVLVENDRVKVYEGRFSPGEKSPRMSDRPARVEFAILMVR